MPSFPALEVADVLRVQSLFVLPSSSSRAVQSRVFPAGQQAKNAGRLAPIEMAAPSIHMISPSSSAPMSLSHSQSPLPAPPPAAGKPAQEERDCWTMLCHPTPSMEQEYPREQKPRHLSPGVLVPLGYITCGVCLLLCHLMAPGYPSHCVIMLSPIWTLTLALHTIGMMNDQVWMWLGLLTILALPFTILLSDRLFWTFYLFIFTVFCSGRFWQALQGPFFLLVGLCWFGLASSLALGFVLRDHPVAYQGLACFFALAAGSISGSRLGRIVYGPAISTKQDTGLY